MNTKNKSGFSGFYLNLWDGWKSEQWNIFLVFVVNSSSSNLLETHLEKTSDNRNCTRYHWYLKKVLGIKLTESDFCGIAHRLCALNWLIIFIEEIYEYILSICMHFLFSLIMTIPTAQLPSTTISYLDQSQYSLPKVKLIHPKQP